MAAAPRNWHLASRVLASVLGGYAFAWAFSALVRAGGAKLAVRDAYFLAELLNVAVFFLAFLWAYAPRRLALVWSVLAGGAVTMAAAAWLLAAHSRG